MEYENDWVEYSLRKEGFGVVYPGFCHSSPSQGHEVGFPYLVLIRSGLATWRVFLTARLVIL